MSAPCKVGDRIRLLSMENDPCPIPYGTEGTVTSINEYPTGNRHRTEWHIGMAWDNGRTLSLVNPPDSFTVLKA
jgi:hypothetical protein